MRKTYGTGKASSITSEGIVLQTRKSTGLPFCLLQNQLTQERPMTAGFILAEATNADGLKEGNGGQKFDDLPAFRLFHLALIAAAKYCKADLFMPELRNQISGGSKQGKPLVKVVAALPILSSNAPWHLARGTDPNAFVRQSRGPIAISGNHGFHDGLEVKGQ